MTVMPRPLLRLTPARRERTASAMHPRCLPIILSLLCLIRPIDVFGQTAVINREPAIKAAYIYQCLKYVRWPDSAFNSISEPLVIGTVGKSSVATMLTHIVARKKHIGMRPLKHVTVSSVDEAGRCHLLYFDPSSKLEGYADALRTRPVLLIGEASAFLEAGGVIAFIVSENKVRLHLSLNEARKRDLTIASPLARITTIVDKPAAVTSMPATSSR